LKKDFLQEHPELNLPILRILECLYEQPIRGTDDIGSGLIISPEQCIPNPMELNIERQVYIKFFYGASQPTMQEMASDNVEFRSCYGTGKGKSTSGVMAHHFVTRPFSQDMKQIVEAIDAYTSRVYSHDSGVQLCPSNSLVIAIYTDRNKLCHAHRDQHRTRKGNFDHKANSQTEKTITNILTVGCSRSLTFQLFRNKVSGDGSLSGPLKVKKKGCNTSFSLTHGSLFQLHPEDERDQFRSCYEEKHQSYYKHNASFNQIDGISIGFIPRSTDHVLPFHQDSGNIFEVTCMDANSWEGHQMMKQALENREYIIEAQNKLRRLFRNHVKAKLTMSS
jgi:hypothetical protein